jgi:hypothetical protein
MPYFLFGSLYSGKKYLSITFFEKSRATSEKQKTVLPFSEKHGTMERYYLWQRRRFDGFP